MNRLHSLRSTVQNVNPDPSVQRLLDGLNTLGFRVASACDLINNPTDFRVAVPFLAESLDYVIHAGHRLCVTRALGVKWKRKGNRVAAEALKRAFEVDPPEDAPWSYRWTIGSSIELVCDPAIDEPWLIAIAANERYGRQRERIVSVLWRCKSFESQQVLERLLADSEAGIRFLALKALTRRRCLLSEAGLQQVTELGSSEETHVARAALRLLERSNAGS
jgi:hypothetical protein